MKASDAETAAESEAGEAEADDVEEDETKELRRNGEAEAPTGVALRVLMPPPIAAAEILPEAKESDAIGEASASAMAPVCRLMCCFWPKLHVLGQAKVMLCSKPNSSYPLVNCIKLDWPGREGNQTRPYSITHIHHVADLSLNHINFKCYSNSCIPNKDTNFFAIEVFKHQLL